MEKDLGIYITSDLKPSTQCVKALRKARSILAMVRRNFKRLDADDFLLIYKTYVLKATHGILYSSVVTSSSEGHRPTSFGKCPFKNSHQNGTQVK